MEHTNSEKEDMDSFVLGIVEKSIDEANRSKETTLTPILGGRVGSDDYSFSFYNPHNARFYFNFNKWNFKPIGFDSINNGHELVLDSFEGCRIVVKRFQIEITNRINSIRKFVISGSDTDRADAMVKACSILELEAIDVLKKFISRFGGTSDFVCISRRIKDNKLLHDEVIDSIPLDSQWNDDVSKKVYNKKSKSEPRNVEFKKEIYAQNYVRNTGLRLFAPEIVQELDALKNDYVELRKDFNALTHENRLMAENMTSHIPFVQEATIKLREDSKATSELASAVKELKEQILNNSSLLKAKEEVSDVSPNVVQNPIPLPITIQKSDSEEEKRTKLSLFKRNRVKSFIEQFK